MGKMYETLMRLLTVIFLALMPSVVQAAEVVVHSIVNNPTAFDHQSVTLQGIAAAVKETTSRRGNDYTTFKLQDASNGETVSVFTWGHPTLASGQCVQVDGVFETEHHQGSYTFHNEVEATKVSPCLSK
jgi:hypothetical protein